jgi:hypothetical protein
MFLYHLLLLAHLSRDKSDVPLLLTYPETLDIPPAKAIPAWLNQWNETMDDALFESTFSHINKSIDFDVAAYISYAKKLRKVARNLDGGCRRVPVYIIESPVYLVEHLLPLFFAVPGWLVLLRGGVYSPANADILYEQFSIPRWAMVEADAEELLMHKHSGSCQAQKGRNHVREHEPCNCAPLEPLLIACTEPRTPRGVTELWRSHPTAITLAHGVDEDPTYHGRAKLPKPPIHLAYNQSQTHGENFKNG